MKDQQLREALAYRGILRKDDYKKHASIPCEWGHVIKNIEYLTKQNRELKELLYTMMDLLEITIENNHRSMKRKNKEVKF